VSSATSRERIHEQVREFLRLNPELSRTGLHGFQYDATTPAPVRNEKPKRTVSSRAATPRLEEYKSVIAKAAAKAGTNNRQFCVLLDRDHVPVLSSWGVRKWIAAYNKPELRTRIRSVKHRLGSPA
jgi:hypothetical protein